MTLSDIVVNARNCLDALMNYSRELAFSVSLKAFFNLEIFIDYGLMFMELWFLVLQLTIAFQYLGMFQ